MTADHKRSLFAWMFAMVVFMNPNRVTEGRIRPENSAGLGFLIWIGTGLPIGKILQKKFECYAHVPPLSVEGLVVQSAIGLVFMLIGWLLADRYRESTRLALRELSTLSKRRAFWVRLITGALMLGVPLAGLLGIYLAGKFWKPC